MTCQKFNERLRHHRTSFNNDKYQNDSELSKYIWYLKEKNIQWTIKWEAVKKSLKYKPGMWYCPLCTSEKLYILTGDKGKMINDRSELMSKCIHKSAYLLGNMKPPLKETKRNNSKTTTNKKTENNLNVNQTIANSTINTEDEPSHNTQNNINTEDEPSQNTQNNQDNTRRSPRIRKAMTILDL